MHFLYFWQKQPNQLFIPIFAISGTCPMVALRSASAFPFSYALNQRLSITFFLHFLARKFTVDIGIHFRVSHTFVVFYIHVHAFVVLFCAPKFIGCAAVSPFTFRSLTKVSASGARFELTRPANCISLRF